MRSLFKKFIESLVTRLLQRVGVEVMRHADAVCVQARAHRDLETLALAEELEQKGAKELAAQLRSRVLAEEMLRLPALNAEVEQLLLPEDGGQEAPAPLPLPARARKPRRSLRAEVVNGQTAAPSAGKETN